MKNLLAITAHPDDDILFAGTLIKLKKNGYRLSEAILTGGEGGVSIKNGVKNLEVQRKSEAERFAELIGIDKIYWIKATDGFLKENQEILKRLVKVIRRVNPQVIILLNPHDYHKDHRAAYKIGISAIELASRNSYSELGKGIDTPLILISDGLNLLPAPDLIIEISKEYETKNHALRNSYESQISGDLFAFSAGVAMARGARIKVDKGEAFNIGKISSRPMLSSKTVKLLKDLL